MTSFYEQISKKKTITDEAENVESRAAIDKWIFRLFLVLMGVMPLVVFGHIEEVVSPLVSNIKLLSSGVQGELFTHYKALMLLAITVIVSILYIMKLFFMEGEIKKTWLNYVLGVFVVMIVVSTIASPNISIALNGQYNRSDGAISWLCYVILMFIAMNIEYPKNFIRYIMYTLMPFIYFNFVIITMNFYGKDVLQNYAWVEKLIVITLPKGVNFGEGSQLLGTLNHGNYMSGMFAIMTIMFIIWAIVEKQMGLKIAGLVTAVAAVLVILMSLSTSGFLTLVCMMPFLLWIVFKSSKKALSCGIMGVYIVVTAVSLHVLAQENPKVWNESLGFFISSNPYVEEVQPTAQLKTARNILATMFENKAYASDAALELPVIPETGVGAGSGRVYIWTYMLDLVKERPLLGYGLDSLMYNFQHYNIDARANLEVETVIVDKPHNMYMGILYGTGVIGFIAFMALVMAITWNALKQIVRAHVNPVGAVLAIGSLAFLFQGLFNDTLPGIGGVMWLLIGVFIHNHSQTISSISES